MTKPIESKAEEITEIEGIDGCLLKWQLAQNSKGERVYKWVRQSPGYSVIKPISAKNYHTIKDKSEEVGVSFVWALEKRKEYLQDSITRNEKSIMESTKKLAGSDEFYRGLLNRRIVDDSKVIKDAGFELKRLNPNWMPKKNDLTDEMIEGAREYPIKSLLPNPINHNMTLCPFHNDKNPSMYINSNYVHCFACNKGWDSIGFAMAMQGFDFKEAVKYLNEII